MTREEAIRFLKRVVAHPNDREGNSRYPYCWRDYFAEIIRLLEEGKSSETLEWVKEVFSQAELDKGGTTFVVCPKCGGDVKVSCYSHSGHYHAHAACAKCGTEFRQPSIGE